MQLNVRESLCKFFNDIAENLPEPDPKLTLKQNVDKVVNEKLAEFVRDEENVPGA